MTKQAVFSDKIASTAGPFSPAVKTTDFVFVSGQVGQDPASGKLVEGGVVKEAEQAFRNLNAVLEASGKTSADVVRVGVYLTNLADFAVVNAIYAAQFQQPFPARTTIGVAALPLGATVELDAIVAN